MIDILRNVVLIIFNSYFIDLLKILKNCCFLSYGVFVVNKYIIYVMWMNYVNIVFFMFKVVLFEIFKFIRFIEKLF